jgi:hypothetical protein
LFVWRWRGGEIGRKGAKIGFFEKKEKKVVLKFCGLKNFRLLCTSIGDYTPM